MRLPLTVSQKASPLVFYSVKWLLLEIAVNDGAQKTAMGRTIIKSY